MSMETIENTQEKLILRMDVNYSLANAIRRSIEEIDILAVDEVEIFANDSALYDEYLSHRIGLIPLKTDKRMGESTKVEMKLKKKGPCWVYSGDLKGAGKVVYENIPITLLEEGQEIELIATATLGKGVQHAKYSPGLCYYRDLVEIKSAKAEVEKIIRESKGVIKPEKKGNSWVCDLPESDVDKIKEIDKESIKDAGEIIIFIESWGQISAKDILSGAVDVLGKNLDMFEKLIK